MKREPGLGVVERVALGLSFGVMSVSGVVGAVAAGQEYWDTRMAQYGALNDQARYDTLDGQAVRAWDDTVADTATAVGSVVAAGMLLLSARLEVRTNAFKQVVA